ncbi:MAG: DNA replication/repair protein RecF [Actinomycetota bacterium]
MRLDRLSLLGFRNYDQQEIEFAPGLNVIVGRNGQGKTNLLEAVHVLGAHGSHRTSLMDSLIRFGAERAVLRAAAEAMGRALVVESELRRGVGVRLLVNKVPLDRGKGGSGALSVVMFSPEDLDIVKGGPEGRRRFLDQAAARLRPLAGVERQSFERVLRQRNGALKAAQTNRRAAGMLGVWDEQLARTGAVVVRNRLRVLGQLVPAVTRRSREIGQSAEDPVLRYESEWAAESDDAAVLEKRLSQALEETAARDIERGATSRGPHRDDLAIALGRRDARAFASQGEQRTLALSLRLAEHDLVTESRGEAPILLLDDVFSELDEDRREHLTNLVRTAGQTIATTTSTAGLDLPGGRELLVEAGRIAGANG